MNKLEEFKKELTKQKPKGSVYKNKEGFWFAPQDLPFNDFNKEIFIPGSNKSYPDGVVGIRVDDNFWAVAALPYEFKDFSIKQIVEVFWPGEFENAEFHPDEIGEIDV